MPAQRHCLVECVPFEKLLFSEAPIYFKKALLESDEQWAQHKKVIDTKEKGANDLPATVATALHCAGLRRSIPKNFPYFHVEFGMDGGYAHVIENEDMFPQDFGKVRWGRAGPHVNWPPLTTRSAQEVVCGMLEEPAQILLRWVPWLGRALTVRPRRARREMPAVEEERCVPRAARIACRQPSPRAA